MKKSTEMALLLGSALFINHEWKDICKEADKNAWKSCKNTVINRIDDADFAMASDKVNEYHDAKNAFEDLVKHNEEVSIDWDRVKRLKDEADADYKNGLEEFKKSLGYSEKLNTFEQERVDQCYEAMKEIDYGEKFKSISDGIDDLNEKLDDLDDFIDNLDLEDYEARAIRRETERSLKDKLKKLETEKKDLVKQRDDIVAKSVKEYNNKVKELDKEVDLKKAELAEICKNRKKAVDNDIAELKKNAREHAYDSLSEESKDLIEHGNEYEANLKKLSKKRDESIKDIYNKLSKTDKLAAYAKAKGKSKSEVVMIAAIPAVPVGYVGWKYVKFIKDILDKM